MRFMSKTATLVSFRRAPVKPNHNVILIRKYHTMANTDSTLPNKAQLEVTLDEYPTKRCVLYLKDRVEYRTAWFYSKQRAFRALEIMRSKYGHAIIYID